MGDASCVSQHQMTSSRVALFAEQHNQLPTLVSISGPFMQISGEQAAKSASGYAHGNNAEAAFNTTDLQRLLAYTCINLMDGALEYAW